MQDDEGVVLAAVAEDAFAEVYASQRMQDKLKNENSQRDDRPSDTTPIFEVDD